MNERPILPNKVYDVAKILLWIAAMAVAAAWALDEIWHFPEMVINIVKSVSAIMGVVAAGLGISTYQYNKVKPQTLMNTDISDEDQNNETGINE